jgi:hypothetical protein
MDDFKFGQLTSLKNLKIETGIQKFNPVPDSLIKLNISYFISMCYSIYSPN